MQTQVCDRTQYVHITSATTCPKYKVPVWTKCPRAQSQCTLGNRTHLQKRKGPIYQMQRRIFEVLRPNHAQISNDRNEERVTAKISASAKMHLLLQQIPFWKFKNTLYHLFDKIRKMQNPPGHNKVTVCSEAIHGTKEHVKRGVWSFVVGEFYVRAHVPQI